MCWPACSSRDCCVYSCSFERCPPFYKTVGRKICCRLHHALRCAVLCSAFTLPRYNFFFFSWRYNNWNRRVIIVRYFVIAPNLAGILRWIYRIMNVLLIVILIDSMMTVFTQPDGLSNQFQQDGHYFVSPISPDNRMVLQQQDRLLHPWVSRLESQYNIIRLFI